MLPTEVPMGKRRPHGNRGALSSATAKVDGTLKSMTEGARLASGQLWRMGDSSC
jgi:hypothetical protein